MGKPIGVGSKMMLPPFMPCGFCDWCKRYPEQTNRASHPVYYGRYLGFDRPPHLWGGWAEYVYVDLGELPGTKIYKLPDDMSLLLGSLSEPLTSCIRGFNRAIKAGGFTWDDTVVIQGTGPIGILAIAAAQEMGAGRVIAVGAPEKPAAEAGARVRRRGHRRHRDAQDGRRPHQGGARHRRRLGRRRGDGLLRPPHRRPRGHRVPARRRHLRRDGPVHRRRLDQTSWHRICTKDLNVLGSWAFTANDLPLGVDMLYKARDKYPWRKMQTLFPFTVEGVKDAVAQAMAMKTVKSTIVPFEELL